MLHRIVKMHLRTEETENFLTHFDDIKEKIRNFPGCLGLSLLQDADHPNIVFTYSQWESVDRLEAYRHSELFRSTWSFVKTLFEKKAEAWSANIFRQL
ncbi:MAG: antibiotic biosynthesis monooxygenase [Saprospiraceae bacterium]|nr:antibiotic biosynthesis monooxygenase [Saprospiraceae bacterium]